MSGLYSHVVILGTSPTDEEVLGSFGRRVPTKDIWPRIPVARKREDCRVLQSESLKVESRPRPPKVRRGVTPPTRKGQTSSFVSVGTHRAARPHSVGAPFHRNFRPPRRPDVVVALLSSLEVDRDFEGLGHRNIERLEDLRKEDPQTVRGWRVGRFGDGRSFFLSFYLGFVVLVVGLNRPPLCYEPHLCSREGAPPY